VRIPKLLRTSSFRLTTAYAALFSVSAAILFVLVYSGTTHYMEVELDTAIASDITEFQDIFETRGIEALIREIRARGRQADNANMAYLLQSPTNAALAGNMPPQKRSSRLFETRIPASFSPDRPARRIRARSVALSDGNTLFVGVETASLIDMQSVILRAFAFSFGITLLLAFVGGIMMSRNLLLHVERVSQTGRDIMAGNLSLRIPVRGVDDEFDHLATSLNLMLEQMERLIESMRQVSNDIAHDLRTPLNRLRQRLERTQRTEHSAQWLRAAICTSITEVDAILDTFSALLRIAQIESATSTPEPRSVDLSEVLDTVVEIYQPSAEEKRQSLAGRITRNLTAAGDRELLAQMVSNLVENAIRHSPEGAAIAVTAAHGAAGIEVVVADSGPGIPAAERDKVFRRFYRLEASRSTPGNGLGLSLVAAIAERHQIAIALEDDQPGLRVRLTFPPAGEPADRSAEAA
jgi:signal transduction histidine kinase